MIRFPSLSHVERESMLSNPKGPVRVVIDTDAANEIDDQFALAWAFLSPERLSLEAIVAAPFSFGHLRPELARAVDLIANEDDAGGAVVDDIEAWASRLLAADMTVDDLDFVGPAEGMELSYAEIQRVMDKLGLAPDGQVFRGSSSYMPGIDQAVDSEGARRIIEAAFSSDTEHLYVLALGCLTNVASAILMEPELVGRVVVVWTAGYPTWAPYSNRSSLNLVQDPWATRLVLQCGVPLVYLPGYFIGSQLRLSLPDMETHVRGRGGIGDYLYHLYTNNPLHEQRVIDDLNARTWIIWDMITVAWLIEPRWVPTELVPTPRLDEELRWAAGDVAAAMRQARAVDRDAVFRDFFRKLEAQETHARSGGS